MLYQKIYKILTYILYPFAFLFAINVVSSLLVALANPLMLVIVFVMACVPLYVFFSSKFFFKGIKQAKPCKKSLKDLIMLNGVISMLFGLFLLLSSIMLISVLNNPEILKQLMLQMPPAQKEMYSSFSQQQMITIFKGFVAIITPFSIVLITHIILTFNLTSKFGHVFDEQ